MEILDKDSKVQRIAHVEELIDSVADADLIVLPEIWNIGWFSFDLYSEGSETLQGETVSRLAAKARAVRAYIHAGSLVESTDDGFYNSSILLDPKGEIIATYRKVHLFGYGSAEPEILKPGKEIVVAKTEIGAFGLSTCYDLRFPELYRKMVDKGAEVFLVASAWPYPRLDHWRELNHVRAFENQCFLVSSNCVGVSRGARFLGHSNIVDPWGIPLVSGGDYEGILKAEIEVADVHRIRADFPPLHDRVIPI